VFVLGRPDREDLDRLLESLRQAPLTYAEVGATRGVMPEGYRHDEYVMILGQGDGLFARAVEGLRRWEAHRGAGLRLRPDAPELREGTTVVQALALPVISAIAACRIVYVVDEPGCFGFAYGSLPAHPEQGEEAFVVHRDADGSVRFVITVFSRPRHPLARLGAPVTRRIQQDITRRYLEALKTFVAAS
jgi:uncharacterized protein (UPF0548 family)